MAILDKVYLGQNRWLVEYKDNSGQIHTKIVYLEN